ncbi:Serine protease easter, partial [Clarias magur]
SVLLFLGTMADKKPSKYFFPNSAHIFYYLQTFLNQVCLLIKKTLLFCIEGQTPQ